MLTLTFNKSRSIKLSHVLKWSALFSGYEDNIDSVALSLPVKEVFERWDDFNSIFWTVVDWKGTYFSFENMEYHSHIDKTRIFYALQNSHWKWMNYIETRVALLYNTTKEELRLSNLNTSTIDDETADLLIDLYSIKKEQ
jgi:hypothetical protein